MWLINKKGELVDMNARANLEQKVEALFLEEGVNRQTEAHPS